MGTTYEAYISQKKQRQALKHKLLHVGDRQYGHLAANELAAMVSKVELMKISRSHYISAMFTETKDNSSTVTPIAGGLRLQTQATPSDNDDIALTSLGGVTLAAGMVITAFARVAKSSAANIGYTFGIATAATAEINSANPADGLFLISAKNSATVVGRCVSVIGGAAADSGTLKTMTDGAYTEMGFVAKIGSTAAASYGSWFVDGVETAFTSTQITRLVGLGTVAVTANLGARVNGTTQRNVTVDYAMVQVDR